MKRSLLIPALAALVLSAAALSAAPIRSMLASSESELTPAGYDLPDGIVPVEYIESTGTQWIDTGVNADSNLSVEITMANAGTPWTNTNPMGAIRLNPTRRHHQNFASVNGYFGIIYYFGQGDKGVKTTLRPTDGEIFTFKVDAISKTFTLGSFLGTFVNDTFDTGLSYWLFGRNGTTPPYLGLMRIYSAKLWNGSTLVRDFQPVRFTNEFGEWEGAMYDSVTDTLFFNQGTGSFIIGPDL